MAFDGEVEETQLIHLLRLLNVLGRHYAVNPHDFASCLIGGPLKSLRVRVLL